MESVDLEMNDIFEEVEDDEDVGALGALPDLPDSTQNEDQDDDADQADVEKRLKALSKGAAKKVVRRPQPKLDADRLTGSRGIPILPKIGEKLKFKGKNHEAEDLAKLMREMEHWAHRLFPKMPFDEVVERVEKLGSKGPVKTCIRKMRLDMPVLEDEFVGSDKEEDDIERIGDDTAQAPRNEEDMWDDMMEEQAQIRRWEDRDAAPKEGRRDGSSPQTLRSDLANRPIDVPDPSQTQTPAQTPSTSGTFTPEQLARMERNKQLALERKLKKAGIMSPALKKPQPVDSEIYTATPLRIMTLTEDTSNSCSQSAVSDSENQMSEVIQPGTSQNVVIEKRQEDAQNWCTQLDSAGDRAGNVLADPDDLGDLVDESTKEKGQPEGKSLGFTNNVAVLNESDDKSTSDVREMDKEKKDLNKGLSAEETDTDKNVGAITDSSEMSEVIPNQNSENIVLKLVANDNNVVNTKKDDVDRISKQGMPGSSEMEIDSEDKENSVSIDIKDKVSRGDINRVDAQVKCADNVVDDEMTEDQLMESLND